MVDRFARYWALPLRILIGIGFMIHGFPKLTAEGHAGFAGLLQKLSFPAPELMAWVGGIVESFGGIFLVLGLLTAEAAALLIVQMLVAMFKVHLPHGFTAGDGGIEVPFLYVAGLLALFVGGPGPLSVDEGVLRPESKLRPPWLRHRVAHA
jgi:putative oxidoreductase